MVKEFASKADLGEKQITFSRLADNAYAYTAEGDPNTGVIIGDDGVMVIDTQATPLMAERGAGKNSNGHRQTRQVRGHDPLSRSAGTGRQRL